METTSCKTRLLKALLLFLYSISFRLSAKVWFTNINDYNYFISGNIIPKKKAFLTKNYVDTDEYFPYKLSVKKQSEYKKEFNLSDNGNVVIMVAMNDMAKRGQRIRRGSCFIEKQVSRYQVHTCGPRRKNKP